MLDCLRKFIAPTNPLRLAWHFFWEGLFAVFYRFPARELIVIGVTGTNGKTTTANLIAKLLEAGGHKVALATTINFQIGAKRWENLTKKTTLGRGGVNRFLRQAVNAGCTHAILEISSHALIQHRVSGVDFDAAVLTNITSEHLDFHGTFAEYVAAKKKLFENLATNRKPGEKLAVLPATDPSLAEFERIALPKKILFGLTQGDLTAENLTATETGQKFTVASQTEKFELATRLLGGFNAENLLAAVAVARHFGVPIATIQKAVRDFPPVPGRLEAVSVGQPFRVIVDFAHTPDALEKLLQTFRPLTSGKIWLVFGATGDRDRGKRPVMGAVANRLADAIVLTSDDPFTEDPEKIIAEVAAGIPRAVGQNFVVEANRGKAIRHALTHAGVSDTVLIAGKGCEQFQVVGHTKIPWDDRKLAAAILRESLLP